MRTSKIHATLALAILLGIGVQTSFAQCNAALFAGGAGTEANPYQISTPEQLQNLNKCLGSSYQNNYYVLNNDIDLASYLSGSEEGWQPIGSYIGNSNYFYGKFNGNGHKVSGLWINRPSQNYVGLFGYASGEIRNIGVEIDNDKGGVKGSSYVGGLVGSGSTISGSYATGSVEGNGYVGGLVGRNYYYGTISDSYATGNVTGIGSNSCVGGLVGLNDNNSTVNDSYVTGAVTGTGNSYNNNSSEVGGLVGRYGTISNSYYDKQTSGQSDTGKGTGKTTAQMKTQSTYQDWDFESIWEINPAINGGYPILRNMENPTPIIPNRSNPVISNIGVKTTSNAILLSNLPANAKVEIYNLQGKQIYSAYPGNPKILKIGVQTKGMYIVKAGSQSAMVVVR